MHFASAFLEETLSALERTGKVNSPDLRFPGYKSGWNYVTIGSVLKDMRGGASLKPSDFVHEIEGPVIPKKAIVRGGKIEFGKNRTYCSHSFFDANPSNQIDKSYLVTTLRDLVPSGPTIGYIVKNEEDGRFILAQGVYGILVDQKQLVPELLTAISNRDWYRRHMCRIMVGSTQVHIRNGDFTSLKIAIPEIEEQKKIAEFLGAVDEKIRLLQSRHDQLTLYKKGVMQKIFAKDIRFKADDGSDFPDWEVSTLGELAIIQRGASPRPISSPKWFSELSEIGWVRIADVTKSKKYLTQTTQKLSKEGVEKSRFIPAGNLIMSICATIGRPIITSIDTCIHDGFVVFKDLKGSKSFLYHLLSFIRPRWFRYGQPGIQLNLNTEIVSSEKFEIPSPEEQQKIADFLSAIDDKIEAVSAKVEHMQSFKKGLLQQMFV